MAVSSAMVANPSTFRPLQSPFRDFAFMGSVASLSSRLTAAKPRCLSGGAFRAIRPIRAQSSSHYLSDAKFYKIEAILRPWRVSQVSAALLKMGIRGVTISDVRGFGAQGGSAERQGGSEFSEDKFLAKVKMEIVLTKDQVDAVIDKIIEKARTGEIGDGKIFVMPIADIIRIRTGERGESAERMSGGRADMSMAL
ncbi:hypothetical protein SAY87_003548 [Trapa incisa]|uniref:Nitrogen regulatory protein P-II homolog n=1 Tax=Trapa incisa TaxID=236973 RepID=A0AAN7QHU5_9MYRT|nr:hypothetical protein SAY87_003548 [Trapa incisa]